VKLWSVETGQHASEFKAENAVGLNDIAWSRDGRLIATASDEPIIRIWDVHNQKCVKQLTGHTNYVMSVDFSPSSNLMIASASFDESIRMWDAKTGQCLRTLPAHSDPVSQVTFNRDGTRLASGGYDGLIRVWDSSSGQQFPHREVLFLLFFGHQTVSTFWLPLLIALYACGMYETRPNVSKSTLAIRMRSIASLQDL
jgi:COMPASS component SWD3